MLARRRLETLYTLLFDAYGPQGWWPLTARTGGEPVYRAEMWREARTPAEIFEIGLGAVLTQRIAWRNVRPVIARLSSEGLLDARALSALPQARLEALIRSAGTFRRKSRSLLAWAQLCASPDFSRSAARPSDGDLRRLEGFGPETVDSILLYGYGVPRFIADAYARRILVRLGLVARAPTYESLERQIGGEPQLAKREVCDELHALLVRLGKEHCRPKPICAACPVRRICDFGRRAERRAITS